MKTAGICTKIRAASFKIALDAAAAANDDFVVDYVRVYDIVEEKQ